MAFLLADARPGSPASEEPPSTAISTPTSSVSSSASSISSNTQTKPMPHSELHPWPSRFDIHAARLQSWTTIQQIRSSSAEPKTEAGIVTSRATPGPVRYDADVIVIGAGVGGCALATALGKQGRKVLIIESSLNEPNRIVGELLQPGGVKALDELGLGDCVQDIDGIPTEGYYVMYQSEGVRVAYPIEQVGPGSAKRPKGVSFHHGRFIQRLRAAVQKTANVTFVEATVNELIESGNPSAVVGVQCTPVGLDGVRTGVREQPVCFYAPLTFAVNGYDSFLRKRYLTSTPPQVKSRFWGTLLYNVSLPMPEHGHALLGKGKPILLYQIGQSETRLLADVPTELPTMYSKPDPGESGVVLPAHRYLRKVVLPALPVNLQAEFSRALDEKRLRSMPNSWLPPSRNTRPGLAFLGDALNMRHPLTGGGMTIALKDVVLLSKLLSPEAVPDFASHSSVLSALSKWHSCRKAHASVINTLAQALYSVFADSDPQGVALREGCFDYFLCGGQCVSGPMSLLGGLVSSPYLLLYHFFAVAFHSIWIAGWKSAAEWTGTGAFFNQGTGLSGTSGAYGSPFPATGTAMGMGGMDVAGAQAAGCPFFAGNGGSDGLSARAPGVSMPSSHPPVGPGSASDVDFSAIPASCPMSAMYNKGGGPSSAPGGFPSSGSSDSSYWRLVLACVATLVLFPVAWVVNAVPLLYRACVVIGPVILAEIFA